MNGRSHGASAARRAHHRFLCTRRRTSQERCGLDSARHPHCPAVDHHQDTASGQVGIPRHGRAYIWLCASPVQRGKRPCLARAFSSVSQPPSPCQIRPDVRWRARHCRYIRSEMAGIARLRTCTPAARRTLCANSRRIPGFDGELICLIPEATRKHSAATSARTSRVAVPTVTVVLGQAAPRLEGVTSKEDSAMHSIAEALESCDPRC